MSMVPQGADAADDWIVEHADARRHRDHRRYSAGQPRAGQGRPCAGPTGKPFTESSIGMALAMRELNQHLRETGESKGYNASFSPRDRSGLPSGARR